MTEEPSTVILSWDYQPTNFFEETMNDLLNGFNHEIGNGRITVIINYEIFKGTPDIEELIAKRIHSIFYGFSLINHKHIQSIKAGGPDFIYPDGRRSLPPRIEIAVHEVGSGSDDIVIYDSDGNIKGDTKKERYDKQKRLAFLVEKHKTADPVVASILTSYQNSISNPQTELVHLYEIMDALSTRFGNDDSARTNLGISRVDWRILGRLANHEPLTQGRHRGEHFEKLRNVTSAELEEARRLAISFIIAYLEYLDGFSP